MFTDNNPLVHLQSAKLGAVEQRWAAQLANYQFDVKYRPGKENADVLSRFPPQVQSPHSPNETAEVESCLIHAVWGPDHWQPLQEGDPTIQRLRYYEGRGQLPTKKERNNETATVNRLLGQWDRLEMVDGLLVRWVQDPATKELISQRFLFPYSNGGLHGMSTTDVKVIWVPQRSAPTSAEAFTGPKWRKIWSNGHPNVRGVSDVSHIQKVKHL